jgi:hypothetical protein
MSWPSFVAAVTGVIAPASWGNDVIQGLQLLKTKVNDDGTLHGCARWLDGVSTEQVLASSVTETSVYSFSVPGGTIGFPSKLVLDLEGSYLNNTGSNDTFTIRVKFGGTTVSQGQLVLGIGPNRYVFHLRVVITNSGATNAQRITAELWSGCGVASPAMGNVSSAPYISSLYDSLAIDTLAAQTLDVTAQHATNSASISFKRLGAALLLMKD